MPVSFGTYGDLGDVIYLMPCMQLMPRPVILYLRDGLRPEDPFTAKLPTLAPLLLAQDYVAEVKPWNGEPIDHDASFFRDAGLAYGATLAHLQAQWLGLNPTFSRPWITVKPRREAAIVVHRSPRYQNMFFPWRELVAEFGSEMIMVGVPHEHEDFVEKYEHIPYRPTANLLEVAQLIAGAELFIGNQSCCYAIAEGLKHNSIQETNVGVAVDCIFPRKNGIFCHDGALDTVILGQRFQTESRMIIKPTKIETPPGGWRVKVGPCSAQSYSFDVLMRDIVTKLTASNLKVPANLVDLIIDQSTYKAYLDHPVTRLKAELGAA
jgi:hypothetical protein